MVSGLGDARLRGCLGVDIRNDSNPYSWQFISSTHPQYPLARRAGVIHFPTRKPLQRTSVRHRAGGSHPLWHRKASRTTSGPARYKHGEVGRHLHRLQYCSRQGAELYVTPKCRTSAGRVRVVSIWAPPGVVSPPLSFAPSRRWRAAAVSAVHAGRGDVNVLTRLGACPNRVGIGFKQRKIRIQHMDAQSCKQLAAYKAAKLPVLVEFGTVGAGSTQLWGPRPWLDDKNVMIITSRHGMAARDDVSRKRSAGAAEYAGTWPVVCGQFHNSLGRHVDFRLGRHMLRYGPSQGPLRCTVEARQAYNEKVLMDALPPQHAGKLFSDGEKASMFDSCRSIIRACTPAPLTTGGLRDRTAGAVWDTESWVANCEIAWPPLATGLSCGLTDVASSAATSRPTRRAYSRRPMEVAEYTRADLVGGRVSRRGESFSRTRKLRKSL